MNHTRTHVSASGRTAPTLCCRYASWLRPLSLLLALCCFWSFAGSGIALAAAPQTNMGAGKTAPHPFLYTPAFAAPPSPFRAAPAVLRSAPAWTLTQAATTARPHSAVPPETMLDEVGHLARGVPAGQALLWKQELAAHPAARRAALLHIRLGEWQMAANQQPATARQHFRQAQALLPKADRFHGLAAYDDALALAYEGAFEAASERFHALIEPKTAERGYDRSRAALWQRHAFACAAYHGQRAARGIPEPTRLDPLCGAAGLAASLRSLGLPYDKKTVLAACRVTGRGSTSQDLLDAAPRLHVHAVAVTADDQGLRLLPKPLVAYVEHDHFISVVKADNKGVSYLCSDCGMWPGGRVSLTWPQWHMLEATLYITVTRPDSRADGALAAALAPDPAAPPMAARNYPVRVSFNGDLSALRPSLRLHLPTPSLMRGHVFRQVGGRVALCGLTVSSLHCCPEPCPKDKPGKGKGGKGTGSGPSTGPIRAALAGGPGDGDPVNLATGEEEYTPPADLSVYNPHGPSIGWGRLYNSLRSGEDAYQSDDFGGGWSQPYNVQVYDPSVYLAPSNPQITPGTGVSLSTTANDAPAAGLTWDIVRGATTLATSTSPGSWSVAAASVGSSSLTVTAPTGAAPLSGCEVRYSYSSSGYNASVSASFDVVAVVSIPQGASASFAAPGTDTPAAGLMWDVVRSGVTVATSARPGGWQVSASGGTGTGSASVQTALDAPVGTGYEVRVNGGQEYGVHSAFFTVGVSRFAPATGSGSFKYVVEPNGARVQFTAPAAPTAAQPAVPCAVQAGDSVLVEWDYDAASSAGHYTVTLPDRTRWVTTPPSRYVASAYTTLPSYSLSYSLARIVDRNGNALNLSSGYTSPSDNWPLLTGIADGNTGATLLSISRDTTGFVTSVADAYGRSVAYGKDGSTGRLNQVSQIVPTAALSQSGIPSRYAYGYYTIYSHDGYSDLRLHTITTPSPTGSGTGTATINYGPDGFVSSLVDGNGNTRTYTGDTSYEGTPYFTQVTVTDASGSQMYAYSVTYDSNMSQTGETDGAGRATYKAVYADPNDPYRPSTVYDGNAAAGFTSAPTPQILQGGRATFASNSSSYVQTPTWQVLLNGTVVATGENRNGWSVSYSSGSGLFTVGAPASATVGSGYQVQYNTSSGGGYGYGPYGSFSVVASNGKAGTSFTWDGYGNLLSETSARGTTTTYTYDYSHFALGEMTQAQEGSQAPTAYAYDDTDGYTDAGGFHPCGLLSSVTAPLPGTTGSSQTVTTFYTYDTTSQGSHGLGNVLTVTTPGNNAASAITTTYNYTSDSGYSQPAALGQPLTVTNNLGKVTHLRYDAQGNATAVKDALGNETDDTYDIRNARLQTILPATGQTGSGHGGSQTTYLYAEPSAFATAQWPAATLQYGPAAAQTTYDEGNVGAVRQVVSTYGAEGETLSVSGSTEPVRYAYDALYRLKTLTDGGGHTTSYFYNAADYLYQTVYPGAQATPPAAPLAAGSYDTITYPAYDSDGNLLSRVDGNNITTSYAYNTPESRLTDITYPAGSIGSVHLAYDAYGRRSAMTDGTGGQTYAYDDGNELTSKTVTYTGLPGQTLGYAFWPNGSRKTLTTSQGSFSYSYDAVGRMSSLTNPYNETSRWAYQDNGWLQTQTLGNGAVTIYTRNALGEVTRLLNQTAGGATLSDFGGTTGMTYDGAGNRLTMPVSVPGAPALSGTTSYQYDYGLTNNPAARRGQLTQESSTRAGGYSDAFAYDATAQSPGGTSGGPGNPTTLGAFSGVRFNADNQNTHYTYDGNGNQSDPSGPYAYDPENRLTILYAGSQTFASDGDGQQAWDQYNPQPGVSWRHSHVYDGEQPVLTLDNGGHVSDVTTFGPNGLVSVNSYGTSGFYTFDPSGNTSQRLTVDGSVDYSHLTSGFGVARVHDGKYDLYDGMGAQWGYRNLNSDQVFLLGHRYYNTLYGGQFLTRDPMGYGGGINLYGYVGNNPVNRLDPQGLDFTQGDDPNHHLFCAFLGGIAGGTAGIIVGVTISGATGGAGAPVGVVLGGVAAGAMDQAVKNACNGDPPGKDMGDACADGLAGGLMGIPGAPILKAVGG